MINWADYCITAVHYSEDEGRITEVETHYHNGEELASREVIDAATVVKLIDRGVSFVTAVFEDDGEPRVGQYVEIYELNGERFIRSVGNPFDLDNLEQLPRF